MKNLFNLPAFAILVFLAACSPSSPSSEDSGTTADTETPVLHVYSARHYDSDKLLYEAFEDAEGVNVEVREASAPQLLETLKAEGANSPADIVIASDAGALWNFQAAGMTQPFDSDELNAIIPAANRQSEGHWFGLTRRVRLVAYDPSRIEPEQVDEWTDLASADLEGEICVRSSSNIYNLSLMSELIDRLGTDAAQDWATAVAGNMARVPQGGDTDQIKAVAAGECSVAIANHYYWVRLAESQSDADKDVAASTKLIIPSFPDGGGAHVNITGAGITATATDTELAAKFIAFLASDRGQELLTTDTKEFPLSDSATPPAGTELVPAITPSTTPLETFGENQAEAQRLYDIAGWN